MLTINETKNVRLPHRNVTLFVQQLFAWLFFVGETNSSTRITLSFVGLFFLFLVEHPTFDDGPLVLISFIPSLPVADQTQPLMQHLL